MSSPRISFSIDFSGDVDSRVVAGDVVDGEMKMCDPNFEFLSGDGGSSMDMLTADELFCEGRLLPFWQTQSVEKLSKITLTAKEEVGKEMDRETGHVSWYVDDDPSPRPPKCTVLWKELLRLRKQHPPSTPTLSSASLGGTCAKDDGKGGKGETCSREKHMKRLKKRLERTRSASVRIRPVVHVPICTQGKNNAFPLLFALKKE